MPPAELHMPDVVFVLEPTVCASFAGVGVGSRSGERGGYYMPAMDSLFERLVRGVAKGGARRT
jgi:hypothetical protein